MVATDASGAVLWKENYRPYGERLNNQASGTAAQTGFTGKPFDAATGLSYMGARYYNPMLGRFMGVDPVGFKEENIHSFNRYAYANNNPYKFVDPDGKYAELVVEAMSLTVGYMSLKDNLRAGNTGAALADGLGMLADIAGAALPGLPGVAGLGIKASREAAGVAADVASSLPVTKPGTKEWTAAVDALSNTTKGKVNLRTETASDAKALLQEGRGGMDRRKQYTSDSYQKGYEVHNQQNARELGVGNDLQHLKWRDGKAGGHAYYDTPN